MAYCLDGRKFALLHRSIEATTLEGGCIRGGILHQRVSRNATCAIDVGSRLPYV